jgi:hypothetical protein
MTRNVVYKCCTFKRQYACLNAHGSQAGKFGYHKDFSLDFNLLTELPSKLNLLANFGCGDNKTGLFSSFFESLTHDHLRIFSHLFNHEGST